MPYTSPRRTLIRASSPPLLLSAGEDILSYILSHLGIPQLARLCICSRALRAAVAVAVEEQLVALSAGPLVARVGEPRLRLLRFVYAQRTVRAERGRVSGGARHTAIVSEGGGLLTFGHGVSGELGVNSTANHARPQRPLASLPVRMVAAGFDFTWVVSATGDVYSFGHGSSGQLGHGDHESRASPAKVAALAGHDISLVSAGGAHAMYVTASGSLLVAGDGRYGQLGLGAVTRATVPTAVATAGRVVDASAGHLHTALITHDGALHTCGDLAGGKLGLAFPADAAHVDHEIAGIARVTTLHRVDADGLRGGVKLVQVSAAVRHTAGCSSDGRYFLCGVYFGSDPTLTFLRKGSAGANTGSAATDTLGTPVPALRDARTRRVLQVVVGAHHAMILTEDGEVYSLMCDEPRPRKRYPQLGQGRADPTRNRPALVIDGCAPLRAALIAAGQNHSVAWHPTPAPPAPGAAAAAAAAAEAAAAEEEEELLPSPESAPPSPASPARAPSSPASPATPPGLPPSSVYSVFGSHKYGRLAHEREVDAAHPQPVDVTGWVEAQSAVESASETHGDAIE